MPVYKTDDMCIDNTGALGGCVINFKETLNAASNEVVQILEGTPADDFPVISPPTVNLFDQNDLDRFGISTASLPPDSTILNKKTTIFDEYGSEIVSRSSCLPCCSSV